MGERHWNDKMPDWVKNDPDPGAQHWPKFWGKKRGQGRATRAAWHRAERRYAKQLLRDPESVAHRSPVHYESEVNWKGH